MLFLCVLQWGARREARPRERETVTEIGTGAKKGRRGKEAVSRSEPTLVVIKATIFEVTLGLSICLHSRLPLPLCPPRAVVTAVVRSVLYHVCSPQMAYAFLFIPQTTGEKSRGFSIRYRPLSKPREAKGRRRNEVTPC